MSFHDAVTSLTTPNNNYNDKQVAVSCLKWKTITMLVNFIVIFNLYHWIIIAPLSQDVLEMANKDPIDIISVPFPMDKLQLFILSSIASTFLFIMIYNTMEHTYISTTTSSPYLPLQNVYDLMKHIFAGGLLLFGIAILTGASPRWFSIKKEGGSEEEGTVYHTFLATMYMSAIMFGPSFQSTNTSGAVVLQQQQAQHDVDGKGGGRLTSSSYPHYYCIEWINQSIVFVTIIVSTPCMILLILDWGIQNQRWPVPLLLGSTVGHFVGMVVGIVFGWGDLILSLASRNRSRQTADRMSVGDDIKYS
mmetsp:Transcript_21850/g.32500  ORF Transcript_21850/g.32500 Transcript_21850/m.32500 type:complete len:305 (-) Transcript_21850:2427-3341(-)